MGRISFPSISSSAVLAAFATSLTGFVAGAVGYYFGRRRGKGPRWIGHGLDDARLRRSVARAGGRDGQPGPAARNVQVWPPHREM